MFLISRSQDSLSSEDKFFKDFVRGTLLNWKPLTVSKYVNKLMDFQAFAEAEDHDLTIQNFDRFLCEFSMFEHSRGLNPRTIDSDIAGIKTLFADLFLWPIRPTRVTDVYVKGLKKSAPKKKFIASRISASSMASIQQIVKSESFHDQLFQKALCAMIQWDLFCRIGTKKELR